MLEIAKYLCPFRVLLGVCCPGCGMSRAFVSLFQGNIKNAFYFHPLWPLVILVAVLWFLSFIGRISFSKKMKIAGGTLIVIAFFAVYAYRLSYQPELIYIEPKQSLLYRVYEGMFAQV